PFALLPFLVVPGLLVVVKLANGLNCLNFLISMAVILIFWKRSRRVELMLYFVAFVIPAVGTLVNTAGNQGLLAQNMVTANLHQVGSLVHVLVMSYGMALRLRQLQRDKATAEQEVAIATRRAEEQRRFVAMLTHEFRNPLAAIDRSVQMIQMKTTGLMPEDARRLERIRANTATLSDFVDNFLLVEMLEHQGVAASRKHCDISRLLESVIRRQGETEEPRVRLSMQPHKVSFVVDEVLLGVAVGNLLANALRYSPAGGKVDVQVSNDESGLRIRVADDGAGLDVEAVVKLGTPYFRADTSLGKIGR